jgi:DNA polymerase-3 subunit beta
MDLTISKTTLLKALQRVSIAGKKKAAMPICSCVLLEAGNGKLTVSATDLEVGIQCSVTEGLEIIEPGRIAVPAGKLLDIVKVLPEETVGLALRDNLRLEVVSGESISRIGGQDPAEFPAIGAAERDPRLSCSVHAEDLQSLVGVCMDCVSKDKLKYNLCGVYLCIENGIFFAVSTDGHRLALAGRQFEGMPSEAEGLIVPRKGAEEIMKLEPGHVGLHLGKNSLELVQDEVFISVRLVDGEFPNYRKAIPTAYENYCTVDRTALAEAVNRVRLLSLRNVILFNIESTFVFLTASNDIDEGIDSVLCKTKGTNVQMKMDANYLLDALDSLGGSEVVIKYSDSTSPFVLLPANFEKWDERLVVLSPMRL